MNHTNTEITLVSLLKLMSYKIFKHESIDRDYNYQLGYLHWKKPIHANCKLIEKKHTQKAVLCNG